MSQPIRRSVSGQINLLRNSPLLPFEGIIEPEMVEQAVDEEGGGFVDRIYTPFVTLCAFLSQTLSQDHSCREAVARVIAWLLACGRKPCSPETGAYCDARQRLPLGVIRRLVYATSQRVEDDGRDAWLFKGRHTCLIDGSTCSMPDTEKNQRAFPQSRAQGIGLGFPLARIVAIISLSTGVLRGLAIGPYRGKETGGSQNGSELFLDFRTPFSVC